MPHSSGGGSSRGGSFSSSSSRSSSHSGSRNLNRRRSLFSKRSFPGARYYSYYKGGVQSGFYAQQTPVRRGYFGTIFVNLLPIVFLLFTLYSFLHSTPFPKKLVNTESYFTGTYIEDGAGIVNEKEELTEQLHAFQKKTGIIPYIITLRNEYFPEVYGTLSYDSLDKYAYHLYVSKFADESHFLFVYAVNADGTDWYWAGMQGNDTDNILTKSHFDRFQRDTQKYLNQDSYTFDAAMANAFKNATGYMLKVDIDSMPIIVFLAVFIVIFLSIILKGVIGGVLAQRKINEYCDYVRLHPEEYTVDSQANTVNSYIDTAASHEDTANSYVDTANSHTDAEQEDYYILNGKRYEK